MSLTLMMNQIFLSFFLPENLRRLNEQGIQKNYNCEIVSCLLNTTIVTDIWQSYVTWLCEWDLTEWLERMTTDANIATVLGSIPASSVTINNKKGSTMKQCWIYCRTQNIVITISAYFPIVFSIWIQENSKNLQWQLSERRMTCRKNHIQNTQIFYFC